MKETTKNEYNGPCPDGCLNHKYHCGRCNTALTYSPANYASRAQDIQNPCVKCGTPKETTKHRSNEEIVTEAIGKWEQSDASRRVSAVESFSIMHGFSQYQGEYIPDLIERIVKSALLEVESRVRREERERAAGILDKEIVLEVAFDGSELSFKQWINYKIKRSARAILGEDD